MMSTACEIVQLCEGRYDFPIFFHMHNDVDIYRSPKQIRELVRFGVRFLATSGYIRDKIIKCDKNAIVSTLYNGIDLSRYNRKNISHKDELTFLYTGRIIPGKGVKELIQAFLEAFRNSDTSEKDRIKLGDVDVTTRYDKSKSASYTNFNIYSFTKDGEEEKKKVSPDGFALTKRFKEQK